MEKWLVPKHKGKLIKWLLQIAVENDWTILFEYSEEGVSSFLKQYATIVSAPLNGGHHYEADCKLTAVKNPSVADNFIKEIVRKTHVMSGYEENAMLFLFADDYHEHCLSCSESFFNRYTRLLCDQELAECQ